MTEEQKEFQLWMLRVNDKQQSGLTCRTDSDESPHIIQAIEFTDFPLREIRLIVRENVLMLTTEY